MHEIGNNYKFSSLALNGRSHYQCQYITPDIRDDRCMQTTGYHYANHFLRSFKTQRGPSKAPHVLQSMGHA